MLFDNIRIKINEKKYLKYLNTHRAAVQEALTELVMCSELSYLWEDEEFYNKLVDRIKTHDASKYGLQEFNAYRKYYYPINMKEFDIKEYQEAWENHWQNNDHHWQNRQDNTEFTEETKLAILENVCDWLAMGYMYNDRPLEYYCDNMEEIILPKEDLKFLVYVIKALEKDKNSEWYNLGAYLYK